MRKVYKRKIFAEEMKIGQSKNDINYTTEAKMRI